MKSKNPGAVSPLTETAIAAREYEALGWKLVPIPYKEKSPRIKGWNRPENLKPIPANWPGNIGLCHGESGTCSIDIDDLRKAKIWLFSEYLIDIDKYLNADDAVVIISEQENRAKLIYRLEEPMVTRTADHPSPARNMPLGPAANGAAGMKEAKCERPGDPWLYEQLEFDLNEAC